MTDKLPSHASVADAALKALRQRSEGSVIDPADLEAAFDAARAHLARGDAERAFHMFAFLALARPGDERFMGGLGDAHRLAGRADKALLTFMLLNLAHPDDAAYEVEMVDCLMRLKKSDAAASILLRLIGRLEADPQSATDPVAQRARAMHEFMNLKVATHAPAP